MNVKTWLGLAASSALLLSSTLQGSEAAPTLPARLFWTENWSYGKGFPLSNALSHSVYDYDKQKVKASIVFGNGTTVEIIAHFRENKSYFISEHGCTMYDAKKMFGSICSFICPQNFQNYSYVRREIVKGMLTEVWKGTLPPPYSEDHAYMIPGTKILWRETPNSGEITIDMLDNLDLTDIFSSVPDYMFAVPSGVNCVPGESNSFFPRMALAFT
eukprot:gb/GECG01016395.1/.p1 GENE.gb/GECG01016395.1/~~gb/GECG01016395.1/.p1  ORF type:complete len:215 (+),score=17.63 gb/GECG01016395.1/:1-645(+)